MTTATRVFEYWMECDSCGAFECLHTGDSAGGVFVHNIRTAEKVGDFRHHKGQLLCRKCYEYYKGAKK